MSVLSHLNSTAAGLVLSELENQRINTSISTLQRRLNSYFGDELNGHFRFGSSTRGTILPRKWDDRSDIDYMTVFDNSTGYKPQTFISRLRRFAEYYYSKSEIHQSHPTVVLELNHIKFDLVPAYRSWFSGLNIPAPPSGFIEWMPTDPNGFNLELTNKNVETNFNIKPAIRILKYWNALNGYVYNSFDLERAIVHRAYWFCRNLKDYFYECVEGLSTWGLPQYKVDKVQRAKDIVRRVKACERGNLPASAEIELKKLIP